MTSVWFVPTNTVLEGAGGDDFLLTPSDEHSVKVGQYGRTETDDGLSWLAEVAVEELPDAVRHVVEQAPAQPTKIEADEALLRALEGMGSRADDGGA